MDLSELDELKRMEESGMLSITESSSDRVVLENDEVSISLRQIGDETFVAESNNKLRENTVGTTLIETDDVAKALKILRIFKQGVRVGSNTGTVV